MQYRRRQQQQWGRNLVPVPSREWRSAARSLSSLGAGMCWRGWGKCSAPDTAGSSAAAADTPSPSYRFWSEKKNRSTKLNWDLKWAQHIFTPYGNNCWQRKTCYITCGLCALSTTAQPYGPSGFSNILLNVSCVCIKLVLITSIQRVSGFIIEAQSSQCNLILFKV